MTMLRTFILFVAIAGIPASAQDHLNTHHRSEAWGDSCYSRFGQDEARCMQASEYCVWAITLGHGKCILKQDEPHALMNAAGDRMSGRSFEHSEADVVEEWSGSEADVARVAGASASPASDGDYSMDYDGKEEMQHHDYGEAMVDPEEVEFLTTTLPHGDVEESDDLDYYYSDYRRKNAKTRLALQRLGDFTATYGDGLSRLILHLTGFVLVALSMTTVCCFVQNRRVVLRDVRDLATPLQDMSEGTPTGAGSGSEGFACNAVQAC